MKRFLGLYWPSVLTLAAVICILFFLFLRPGIADVHIGDFSALPGRQTVIPILDPGHGGKDGGAVSIGGYQESDINLCIALKMEEILAFFGSPPVLTRDSQEIEYPKDAKTIRQKKVADQKQRAELIRSVEHGVLISIHQNKYSDGGPFGAQVLSAPTLGSDIFAEWMQARLIQSLNPKNHRKATQISNKIYLMNNISCPAILIECGFLSNPEEAALLQTDAYQLKTAAAIASGFLSIRETLADYI